MDNEEFDLEEDKRSESNATGMDKLMNFIKENTKLVIVLVAVVLLIILMMAFSGGGGSNNTGVTISEEKITVTTDTGNQLKLMKDGKEVTGVVWSSKDETVATVDKTGVIKGKKVGKTTIIGKYDGYEYKCEVTVTEGDPNLKVESLKFSESGTILMPVGSTYQVPIQMTPPEARPKNKIFSSSKPAVASIDNTGLITANAKGEAMIRVAVNDAEKMASIKIKVVEGQVTPGIYTLPTSIAFEEKEITLTEGETKTLTYHQEPAEASTDYVMWVSADEEVATVFNGELIAKKPGNIEVAIVSMGIKDIMVVHVKSGTVPVTGITLSSEENITMNVGDQKKIVATVEPSNATNQVVTYLVDNPSVVSVDNDGNISAIGSGSTTITVSPSANLEIKKTIYVTVNEDSSYVPPSDDGGNNGGDNGGNNGGETATVGSVIVTGTNNAVSTDLPGMEVESTTVTMTASGNVDEIKYCYYNKAVTSSCTANIIYGGEFNLPQTTLTTKTTYVIKAIPYYQGNSGTEVIRYVTIKPGSGGDPSDPPVTDNVGTVTISGLYDTSQEAESNPTSMATIVITKNGNVDSVKYCRAASGGTCSSYNVQSLTNGTYSFNLSSSGSWFYEFIPIYNNKEGTKVTKYVKIGTPVNPPANESHCWVNASSQGVGINFSWGPKPANSMSIVQAKALDKQEWCNAAKEGYLCFKDNGGNYYFGPNFSTSTTYTYVSKNNYMSSSDTKSQAQAKCLAKNPQDKCYCNSSHQCRWGQNKDGYTTLSKDIPTNKNECDRYHNNGDKGCFTYNGNLYWGTHMNKNDYTYLSGITEDRCGSTQRQIGYTISSNNLFNNQGTASSNPKTGDQTVTFKINNSGVSYLKVCKGDGCTPSTRVNNNGSFKVTGTGMITVRVAEYDSANNLFRGVDTWYVLINSDAVTVSDINYKVSKTDGKYYFYCTATPTNGCSSSTIKWESSNTSAFEFTSGNAGTLKTNSPTTITVKKGSSTLFSKDYTTPQISPTFYKRTLALNYVANYYNNDWTRENYPMVAFTRLDSTSNFNNVRACHYIVSAGVPVTADDLRNNCTGSYTTFSRQDTGRTIKGLSGNYKTYKMDDEKKVYHSTNLSMGKYVTNIAFEFRWLTDKRNEGYDGKDIILVLWQNNSNTNIQSTVDYYSVYRIHVTKSNMDSSWNLNSNGKSDRFSAWTITDETERLFRNNYN